MGGQMTKIKKFVKMKSTEIPMIVLAYPKIFAPKKKSLLRLSKRSGNVKTLDTQIAVLKYQQKLVLRITYGFQQLSNKKSLSKCVDLINEAIHPLPPKKMQWKNRNKIGLTISKILVVAIRAHNRSFIICTTFAWKKSALVAFVTFTPYFYF